MMTMKGKYSKEWKREMIPPKPLQSKNFHITSRG